MAAARTRAAAVPPSERRGAGPERGIAPQCSEIDTQRRRRQHDDTHASTTRHATRQHDDDKQQKNRWKRSATHPLNLRPTTRSPAEPLSPLPPRLNDLSQRDVADERRAREHRTGNGAGRGGGERVPLRIRPEPHLNRLALVGVTCAAVARACSGGGVRVRAQRLTLLPASLSASLSLAANLSTASNTSPSHVVTGSVMTSPSTGHRYCGGAASERLGRLLRRLRRKQNAHWFEDSIQPRVRAPREACAAPASRPPRHLRACRGRVIAACRG